MMSMSMARKQESSLNSLWIQNLTEVPFEEAERQTLEKEQQRETCSEILTLQKNKWERWRLRSGI